MPYFGKYINILKENEYLVKEDPYAIKIAKLMEYCQWTMNFGSHVFHYEPKLEKAFENFKIAHQDLTNILQDLIEKE